MLFLGRILRGKFYSKHGGIVLELGSIVLRLGIGSICNRVTIHGVIV